MLSFTATDILRNYLGLCVDKYPFDSSVIDVSIAKSSPTPEYNL